MRVFCQYINRTRSVRYCLPVFLAWIIIVGVACSAPPVQAQHPAQKGSPTPIQLFDQPDPFTQQVPASSAVLTQRDDAARQGWNAAETHLNTGDVNTSQFGKRLTYQVDGKIYAQPLYVPNLAIRGITYNVVIVATEHDSVYAFDADARSSQPPLWYISFLSAGVSPVSSTSDVVCNNIAPEVGITGTPVIDASTRTLYVVAATREGLQLVYRLHALDITTGREKIAPARIQASVSVSGSVTSAGNVSFDARTEQEHMGLLLLNGIVYIAFASYCGKYFYHGWILGYRAADLEQAIVYNTTPHAWGGGLWESATGLVADQDGNIYVATGNGAYDLNTGGPDAGDTLLKLRPQNGTLKVEDFFTPFNQLCLMQHDVDLGSGAPFLLPDSQNMLVVGKEGRVYVLDREDLGGYHTLPDPCSSLARTDIDQVVQEFPPQTVSGGVWSTASYWAGPTGAYIYMAGVADHLKAWRVVAGKLLPAFTSQAAETLSYPGGEPVISSNGSKPGSGIVWILDQEHGPALRAYDASNLAHELYNSQQNALRDGLATYDTFSVPTVTNGEVFVGSGASLSIFGLLDCCQ